MAIRERWLFHGAIAVADPLEVFPFFCETQPTAIQFYDIFLVSRKSSNTLRRLAYIPAAFLALTTFALMALPPGMSSSSTATLSFFLRAFASSLAPSSRDPMAMPTDRVHQPRHSREHKSRHAPIHIQPFFRRA